MSNANSESKFWKHWHGISRKEVPSEIDKLNYRLENFDDQDLYWLTRRIKRIGQLDLDETLVTDKGIKHLTDLDSLLELRLKGLGEITDACIPFLNQITTLKTLHLGGTEVTAKGALGLNQLKNLELLFLPEQQGDVTECLNQLLEARPGCELIVNYQRYYG